MSPGQSGRHGTAGRHRGDSHPDVGARGTSVGLGSSRLDRDEDARRALAVLTRDGTSVSTAVRAALIEAAKTAAQDRLRAEAPVLAADDAERAEAAQVLRDMETLRAW